MYTPLDPSVSIARSVMPWFSTSGAQDLSRLAPERGAQLYVRPEHGCHPRHPRALSAGVKMDLRLALAGSLDRDRQQRPRAEHHERRVAAAPRRASD
jgi:hypothetical protein